MVLMGTYDEALSRIFNDATYGASANDGCLTAKRLYVAYSLLTVFSYNRKHNTDTTNLENATG